jgi:hypothetical protein
MSDLCGEISYDELKSKCVLKLILLVVCYLSFFALYRRSDAVACGSDILSGSGDSVDERRFVSRRGTAWKRKMENRATGSLTQQLGRHEAKMGNYPPETHMLPYFRTFGGFFFLPLFFCLLTI